MKKKTAVRSDDREEEPTGQNHMGKAAAGQKNAAAAENGCPKQSDEADGSATGPEGSDIGQSAADTAADEAEAYVYMLRCGDGTLYTGWTNDPARRLAAHQSGKGAKYTRSRLPVEMVYLKKCTDKIEAMRLEYRLKQLSREEKLKLLKKNSKSTIC